MGRISRLLISCLTSLGSLAGCVNRADSMRMLEVRADYDGKEQEEVDQMRLSDVNTAEASSQGGGPLRVASKTAHIWIFPHETPNKEYFWGGWISIVVEGDRWQFDGPGDPAAQKPQSATPRRKAKIKGRG